MNLSAAIMLVNKAVRPVRVQYDPEIKYNNNPDKLFKTLDPTIKEGDLVVVPTNTRQGFTVVKVTEAGFAVDFNNNDKWDWIAAKFDKAAYDHVIDTEKQVITRVAQAQEDKARKELKDAMGLGDVSFSDLDIMALPAATPHGTQPGPTGAMTPAPAAPIEPAPPFAG
ncbi:hypothetical protein Kuura_044 [Caulobacter phage Kuura]|nr:hypothetical protein Kuura_044 [Caulobacter phage Kuura]